MALQYRSGTSSSTSGSSPIVVTKPAGVVAGDLLIIRIAQYTSGAAPTAPAGWTLRDSRSFLGLNSTPITSTIWTRVADGTEGASFSFTSNIGNGLWECHAIQEGVYSTITGTAVAGSTNNLIAPSVTMPSAGGMHFAFVAGRNGVASASRTPPAGYTERADVAIGTSNASATKGGMAAGATGAVTFVETSSASDGYVGQSIAIAPANTAPNSPILTSPIGGATVDRTAVIPLQGTFSDPDVGDQLSQVTVEHRPVGGSTTTVVQSASGQTFTVNITAGTLSAGNYEWRAKTKDNAGVEGPFSAWATFTAAAPPTAPVLVAPAAAATIATNPSSTEWTAPAQDAFQVQTRSASGGGGTLHHDSGVVEQAGTRTYATPRPVTGRTEWTRVRVRVSGLWSTWTERSNAVAYVPPGAPTVAVAGTPEGWLQVTVDNPAGGTTVASNRIHRQQSTDGGTTWTDERGTIDAFNTRARDVAPDGVFVDELVAHRTLYRYRAVAVGDNTTETTGAWTT